jgi:hypothetical protein
VHEGAKLDVVDNEKRTPLVKAVLSGNQNPQVNYQICIALLQGGADACKNSTSSFFLIEIYRIIFSFSLYSY